MTILRGPPMSTCYPFAAILMVTLALFTAPLAAHAQEPTKVRSIGVLWPISDDPTLEAFRQGLRGLGYVEGRNIVVEYRYAEGRDELPPDLAAELVRLNVDVILTWGVLPAWVAVRATTTIPLVNGSMSDPVATGLVASLTRPGGNLTGLSSISPVLNGKRVELITEVVPGLSRLAVLSTANPTARLALRQTEIAAQALGISLQTLEVCGPDDFEGAFSAMARRRAGGLIVGQDFLFRHHLRRLVDLASQHRLPAIAFTKEFVEMGGLISYAPNLPDLFRRAPIYVDKILKGAKPGDLPIEQAMKFELVINLKTAQVLGLTIPPTLLFQADEVFQ
jgi:putative ABC transport system substrate-binding protein